MKFLVFVFFMISFSSIGQSKIYYSDSIHFGWHLFAGKLSQSDSLYSAGISQSIKYDLVKKYPDSIKIRISSTINSNMSWVFPTKKSNEGLKHEFIHFQINEILARKLRCFILNGKFSYFNFNYIISDLLKEYRCFSLDLNKKYDRITDHGMIQSEQRRWENLVESIMQKSKKYDNSYITVPMLYYNKSFEKYNKTCCNECDFTNEFDLIK